jgi:hypothetical protein
LIQADLINSIVQLLINKLPSSLLQFYWL